MREQGTVIACVDGVASVRIDRSEACEGCAVCVHSESGSHMVARAVDRIGVSAGDRVMIRTDGASSGGAGALLFLMPLAFLFGGYGAGALASRLLGLPGASEPAGAGFAVIFFLASFGILSLVTRRRRAGLRSDAAPESVIVEKL